MRMGGAPVHIGPSAGKACGDMCIQLSPPLTMPCVSNFPAHSGSHGDHETMRGEPAGFAGAPWFFIQAPPLARQARCAEVPRNKTHPRAE